MAKVTRIDRKRKNGAPRRDLPTKKPIKQRALPGMEDKANRVLEEIAISYADVRDRRMALGAEEATLKQRAMSELKRLGRQGYHRNGIDISIIPGEETIKVKVAPPPGSDDSQAEPSDGATEEA